ncbi:MAG: 16S rRNA (adenine(1518)-N(6)/adenine(1519)-N(6))-dimethyltransferase RsmA [Lactobacillaceae bacterium]|jgi:16S rRNA (adenine1518-N6/adenine1519-N6)-dimethyltransferase|nr:16S rRNA (adenine(1518)-N(6)/adenine(1519)-N(6))-dimethyltransferase RsmA [Lactobacillaceae bacterium]
MNLSEIMDTLPSLKATVDAYGLMAKKSLGQNFLLDRNITDKIIKMSLDAQGKKDFSDDYVFEVGPGPGGLTRSVLSQNPKKLTVIEMDERCIKIMEDIKSKVGDRLEIISGDAMKQNFALMDAKPRHIVSNLPYNISVHLLFGWLKSIEAFNSMTLMFQKEVADRILAKTSTKDYGRISILSQLLCKVDKLFDINPNCFVPAPKIWSTVLVFRPLHSGLTEKQISNIEKITAAAFGQRRKMIRHSLKSIANIDEILSCLNIGNNLRAEELNPLQFLQIADKI